MSLRHGVRRDGCWPDTCTNKISLSDSTRTPFDSLNGHHSVWCKKMVLFGLRARAFNLEWVENKTWKHFHDCLSDFEPFKTFTRVRAEVETVSNFCWLVEETSHLKAIEAVWCSKWHFSLASFHVIAKRPNERTVRQRFSIDITSTHMTERIIISAQRAKKKFLIFHNGGHGLHNNNLQFQFNAFSLARLMAVSI